MKNKTTVLAQEEKVAIDCAVRHISELFHQCAEHRRSRLWRSVQSMSVYAGMQLRFS